LLAFLLAGQQQPKLYVTFELEKRAVLDEKNEWVNFAVGRIHWRNYTLSFDVVCKTPNCSDAKFDGFMEQTDGKRYPLIDDETVAILNQLTKIYAYLEASEEWYKNGGVYKRLGNQPEDKIAED
jgi:hypothetical protein